MEADLQRFYNVDYRDRWATGRHRLTLRRLWVLVTHLPIEASVARELSDQPSWSIEAQLLDDLRMAMTGSKDKPAKPHPSRPKPTPPQADPRKLAAARRRRDERQRAIEAGLIT